MKWDETFFLIWISEKENDKENENIYIFLIFFPKW